jgi:hypothetical protein
VVAGREWIALNCDPDPYWGELVTPRELYPIELMVDVDPLLNQALVYRIPYRAAVLFVDAHTGAVLRVDGWASSGPRRPSASRTPRAPIQSFWDVALAGGGLSMRHAAVVVVPGRANLWHGYAIAAGVKVTRERSGVVLAANGKKTRLPLRRARPLGDEPVAWLRSGEMYLPVRVLLGLTDRLRVDVPKHCVVVWHPYSRVALKEWTSGPAAAEEAPSLPLHDVLGGHSPAVPDDQ